MNIPRLSPGAYRTITLVALVALVFIAITGAAVRLTGSGLGCPDWPTCASNHVVARWEYHAMVEFVNRTITGLVSVAVIVAVLGSLARTPRRNDLTWLSLGLVGGVVGQIVLGGLTVLFQLRPPFVMAHFLVSMVLIANAVVLQHRAGLPDVGGYGLADGYAGPEVRAAGGDAADDVMRLGRLLLAACMVTLFLGTIVTSAGPHGGDEHVPRLGVPLGDAARLHGIVVMIFLGLTLLTVRRAMALTGPMRPSVVSRCEVLLAVLTAQAAVGYTQYFTGVPVVLVGIHVAGACAVWVATLRLWLVISSLEPSTNEGAPLATQPLVRTEIGHRPVV